MLQVGLTGGIGAGKTTVARLFALLGIPVYNADQRAKYILAHNTDVKQAIITLFGVDSYIEGAYNREYIAERSFSIPELLEELNRIVHPAVALDYRKWVEEHQNVPYLLKEAAILFESGSYKSCDRIVTVYADVKTRLERVKKRDNTEVSKIKARMNNQWPDEEKVKRSDFVIKNDQEQLLIPQIIRIHNQLLNENT